MKSVYARKNQYRGINAHLNSKLQSEGERWVSFHTNHISDLNRAMGIQLRPMGYIAEAEQSLQIRRYGELIREARSDVTLYDPSPSRQKTGPSVAADTLEIAAPIPIMLGITEEEALYYHAIGIYTYNRDKAERGKPVAWVELLSPSNKPGSWNFQDYKAKRADLLQTGLVFVEIDYLHESPPTLPRIASYASAKGRRTEVGSHPYRIIVIDPRPAFLEGQVRVRQVNADESLPTITIPLNGEDVLKFDFGAPYNKTFEELLYGEEVDYGELPVNFDLYSEVDQARILARMLAVLEAAEKGVDLESGTFPVEAIVLQDALARFEQWKAKS